MTDMNRKNRVAQWVFDGRSILGRFHLWLEGVEERWLKVRGEPWHNFSFVESGLERSLVMAAAVTALGTRLFGRWGEGRGLDKAGISGQLFLPCDQGTCQLTFQSRHNLLELGGILTLNNQGKGAKYLLVECRIV